MTNAGQFKVGHSGWLGKKRAPFSEEWKEKISLGVKRAIAENRHPGFKPKSGEQHNNWKGDDAGYTGKHMWIYQKLGRVPECANCHLVDKEKPRKFHWHNISGNYTRELNDWIRLCAHCHKNVHEGKIII